LTNCEVQQFDNNRAQNQPHKKTFNFVPRPGAKSLRRQLVLTLQPKAVVIQPGTERLADEQQQ
jgi:hypothetical protein